MTAQFLTVTGSTVLKICNYCSIFHESQFA